MTQSLTSLVSARLSHSLRWRGEMLSARHKRNLIRGRLIVKEVHVRSSYLFLYVDWRQNISSSFFAVKLSPLFRIEELRRVTGWRRETDTSRRPRFFRWT